MVTGTDAKQRLIDANELIELLASMQSVCRTHAELVGISKVWQQVKHMPTVDAVPTEFVMENFNLEFVCDELVDCGEECSERCQYSEPQPECVHRYIDTIWRKEHEKID